MKAFTFRRACAVRAAAAVLVACLQSACTSADEDTSGGAPVPLPDAAVQLPDAGGPPGWPTPLTPDAGVALDAGLPSYADASVLLDSGAQVTTDASLAVDAAQVDAAVPRVDLGKGNGKDVVLIGDSWMSNTLQLVGTGGGIASSLLTRSKQPYRNHAVQGVMLLEADLFGPAIPTQWDDAVRENPDIETVVMTAGGNDIIQDSAVTDACKTGGRVCDEKLAEIAAGLKALWAKMVSAGVKDILHVTYSSAAGSVKDFDKNVADIEALCAAVPAPTRCHVLRATPLVGKSDLAVDGIHPLKATNDRLADAILALMAAEGMRR